MARGVYVFDHAGLSGNSCPQGSGQHPSNTVRYLYRVLTHSLSGSKVAEDVEEQLRFIGSRGIDRAGTGGGDGHVRCNGPVIGVECGDCRLGYARRSWPEGQELKRSRGYDRGVQNEG